MKKILSLMTLLLLTVATAWAGTATFNLGAAPGTMSPANFFTHGDGTDTQKWNFNSKYNGGEYDGITFSNGLKMEGTTFINFTTNQVSTVTIVKATSANDSKTIKFDGNELAITAAVAGTGCQIFTLTDVAAGNHSITRGSGESGLFYVKVEWADSYSATYENTGNWAEVWAYTWSGEDPNKTEQLGGWPGTQLTADGDGKFPVNIPDSKPEYIIFNNGDNGQQTSNFEFVNGSTYTQTGRVIIKQDFTLNFKTDKAWEEVYAYAWNDNENSGWTASPMTKVDGVWTATVQLENEPTGVLFHNGKDGDAQEKTPDYTYAEDETYEYMQNTYTATFTTDAAWEKVHAYAWTDGDKTIKYLGDWPGPELTADEKGIYTVTISTYEKTAPARIQFNGGTDETKTPDMTFTNNRAYKWITSVTPVYALAASSEKIPAGTSVGVLDNEEVVATLTYGVEGGAEFNNPVAFPNEDYAGFTAYTTGNGQDGSDTGGTVYYIEPVYDGIITVGVCLNANKNFYILEDGTALADFNGITLPYKAYTTFTFPVKGGSKYSIYCTGSKLGFFGFDYEFPEVKFKVGGSMNDWSMVNVRADSYTFENLAADTEYQFKVIDGGNWKGYSDLTDVAGGLYAAGDGNICFKLAEAGDVTVTYVSGEEFTVSGNFVLPQVVLAGTMTEWETAAKDLTPAGDKKSASVTIALEAANYEFKMIVDGTWLTKEGEGETSYVLHRGWRTVDGVSQTTGKNMTLQADYAGEYTFTWEYATNTLTVTYPTGDLTLSDENDNTEVLTNWDGTSANITLNRTLVKDTWNTLALPFTISSDDFSTLQTLLAGQATISLKELTDASFDGTDVTLTFDDADGIQAGHPYLVKVSKDINLATLPAIIDAAIALSGQSLNNPFKNVEISNTTNSFTSEFIDFIPTLGATTIEGTNAKSVLFLAAENKLKNPTSLPADIKGFRAYFQLKAAAEGARAFNLDLGEGETTGISTVSKNNVMMNNDVYDLQGRKVQNAAQKGIYIMNGRKVVNK